MAGEMRKSSAAWPSGYTRRKVFRDPRLYQFLAIPRLDKPGSNIFQFAWFSAGIVVAVPEFSQ
jgi:hypothetical protein